MYICRFLATCKHAPRASDIPSLQKWSQKSMIGPCLLRILGVKCLGCLDLETNFWHWSLCCRPSHILSCLRCTSPVRFHMRRLPSCFSLGMFQRLSLASCSWCRSGAPGAGISCHPWWLRFCLGSDARMPISKFEHWSKPWSGTRMAIDGHDPPMPIPTPCPCHQAAVWIGIGELMRTDPLEAGTPPAV